MDETEKLAIVVSEGTFDKGMTAMILGNTAAMGMEASLFFTFFGLNLHEKGARPKLPGIYRPFTGMFVRKMAKGGVENFAQQLETAKDLGIRLYACNTSMGPMGVTNEGMTDGVKVLGESGFLNIAADTDMQYFIG